MPGRSPDDSPWTMDDGQARAQPVSARIAQQIVADIRSGVYPVGSKLLSEQRLAEEFAVSRPSVREALCALQFAGYVESAKGAGCFVVSREATLAPEGLSRGASTTHDRLGLLEARLVLEPAVVRLGALDPHPAALRAAAQLIEGMRVALGAPSVHAATDLRIHLALVETCRNRFLVDQCKEMLAISASSVWQSVRKDAWTDERLLDGWLVHHEAVLAALRDGRAADAERVSREHLLSVVAHALVDRGWSPTERSRLQDMLERFEGVAEARPEGRDHGVRRPRRTAKAGSAVPAGEPSAG